MLRASCEHQTDIGKPEYSDPTKGNCEDVKYADHLAAPVSIVWLPACRCASVTSSPSSSATAQAAA